MAEHITIVGETIAESLRKTADSIPFLGVDSGPARNLMARLLRNGAAEIEGLQNEARFRSHVIDEQKAEIERLRALNEQMADAMDSTINGLRGLENTLRIAGYPSEARNLETKIGSLRLVVAAARQEPS